MEDGLEVEGKYRISCNMVEEIASTITRLGGVSLGEALEEDKYYQHPCRNFGSTDEALRIRYVRGKLESLTYKGPKRPGNVKARTELILKPIGGPVEEVLEKLGFKPVAVVVKRRRYYRLGKALITIDRVEGLGCFIEIEAPTPGEIQDIARELGITSPPILESYLEMLLREKGLL
ncbi:MAG: class IV adenylate cyclase [Desulfurococcales archaeon]|nr:class IV adenylate cyclase [Desulfurococcales archaeon]